MRQARHRIALAIADLGGSGFRPAALLTTLALGLTVAACDGTTSTEPDRAFDTTSKAATAAPLSNAAVFGFEVAGAWSTTSSAILAQSTTKHSEGAASLSVRPGSAGYVPLKSVPLSNLAAISPTLAVDVMLPTTQPNPNWYGTFKITLNSQSRGVYSQFLGQVELTGKPRGTWVTLTFPVSNAIIAALVNPGYSDLVITLGLSLPSPNTQTYYVDNLRFVPVSNTGCTGRPNGTACNDGNACTAGETCQSNVCTPKTTVTCTAPDQCHTAGTCNTSTGLCQYPTKADGATCNDGNACTQTDTCQAGTCQGANPVVCTASDQCHLAGVCNSSTGLCSNPNKPDGTSCDDTSVCTVGDICQSGSCTGASALNCDDGIACTVDSCDATAGCMHTDNCPRPCGGIAGIVCESGRFCSLDVGTCRVSDVMGNCKLIPATCPATSAPVCGCDGRTYANQCEADKAGVSIESTGACPTPVCGGIAGIVCPTGQFCSITAGVCNTPDAQGTCAAIPATCPADYVPVCGCDGRTYGNQCEADKAGVSISQTGVCPTPVCGGVAGIVCPEGQFCSLAAGVCNTPNAQGTCAAIPASCPTVYVPICGCDGRTYASQCDADLAGVSIAQTGECPVACGGLNGIVCPAGQFCSLAAGSCNTPNAQGTCTAVPTTCPTLYAPVCGCDGITYDNQCTAEMAGVSVAQSGECPATCGGANGIVCPTGQFCAFTASTCNTANAEGTCKVVPTTCAPDAIQVCGCDGITYANQCAADMAGVTVSLTGACPPSACGGIAGIVCPTGQFCAFTASTCNTASAEGTCKEIPATCAPDTVQVCGCDGITYANQCAADMASVTVSLTGACPVSACGGPNGIVCPTGQFCAFTASTCNTASAEGTCKAIPATCAPDTIQVCGCDGITYANQCAADMASVTVSLTGACPVSACGGPNGIVCPTGQFCAFTASTCNTAGAEGTCKEIPATCAPDTVQVCGCDGITYANQCAADMAGVTVSLTGACPASACGGPNGITCPDGQFCSMATGSCNTSTTTGTCAAIPASCPALTSPVCGCDGRTYTSPCEASLAGVSVDYTGECIIST